MTEHTPTPWKIREGARGNFYIVAAKSMRLLTGAPMPEANAALIVRAVNSHDALVKALGAIAYEYANQDLNHVDFRVAAFKLATEALGAVKDENEPP